MLDDILFFSPGHVVEFGFLTDFNISMYDFSDFNIPEYELFFQFLKDLDFTYEQKCRY